MDKLRRWINRKLAKAVKPAGPVVSTFGTEAERTQANKARDDNFDTEVAKMKNARRDF